MTVLRYALYLMSVACLPPVHAQALSDPTRPAGYGAGRVAEDLPEELDDWKVTAIRISENDRAAIVNGTLLRAGDGSGPATVREIQPDRVILEYDGRMVEIRLYEQVAMRKPAGEAGIGSGQK